MKKVLVFLGVILLLSLSGNGQTSNIENVIPKKANTIIIVTDTTENYNFIDFGKFLIRNGVTFAKKDKDFYSLVTNVLHAKKIDYKLIINFINNDIIIRPEITAMSFGAFMSGSVEMIWLPWEYSKSKGNINNWASREFIPILKEYNGKLKFIKK